MEKEYEQLNILISKFNFAAKRYAYYKSIRNKATERFYRQMMRECDEALADLCYDKDIVLFYEWYVVDGVDYIQYKTPREIA